MMSIFRIPDDLVDDIQSMFAKFWWGSNDDKRKIMCLPKNKEGLGFRDMKIFNSALIAKQSWRLVTDANPLLKAVLADYFVVLRRYRWSLDRAVGGDN